MFISKLNDNIIWDKVFKSVLSKFFKGCLPQNLLSPLFNTLSDRSCKCEKMLRFTLLSYENVENVTF